MIDWAAITGFEWDAGNLDKNRLGHGVECDETEQVFANHPRLLMPDEKHSAVERRWRMLGIADEGRLLHIVFTMRGNLIRIISARGMNRKERSYYENI